MSEQAALEARMLVEDRRYEAYRAGLEESRDLALRKLLRRNQPFETMTRLAGEVSALDYALGLPAELLGSHPTNPDPDTP